MKIDAEFVKKNFFWLLLAATAPMILLALIVLGPSVGSLIAEENKKITVALEKLQKVKDPKNKTDVKTAEEKAKQYLAEETKVWKKAYADQRDVMFWPKEFEEKFHFTDGIFAVEINAERGEKDKAPPAKAGWHPPAADQTEGSLTGVIVEEPELHRIRVKLDKTNEADKGKKEPPGEKGKSTPGKDQSGAKEKAKETPPPPAPKFVDVYETSPSKLKVNIKGKSVAKASKYRFTDLRLGDRVEVKFQVGKYFGDPVTQTEFDFFSRTYLTQLHDILKLVQPVTEKGEGVVQLGGWEYDPASPVPDGPDDRFLIFYGKEWKIDPENYKDVWTAQEDLWIQRELYQLIANANDFAAECDRQKGGKDSDQIVFTNPRWELGFTLNKESRQVNVTLTNTLSHVQPANVNFLVTFKLDPESEDGKREVTEKYDIQVGSLKAGAAHTFTRSLPEHVVDVASVKQVLNWETAAVKRISEITLGSGSRPGGSEGRVTKGKRKMPQKRNVGKRGGEKGKGPPPPPAGGVKMGGPVGGGSSALSNRQFGEALKPFFKGKPGAAPAAPPPKKGGGPVGKGDAAPPDAGEDTESPNGFDLERYLEITPQARRVPVAMVLVIDQNQLNRVLTSFSNSKLRFMTTQVLLNRYPWDIDPTKASTAKLTVAKQTPGGLPPGFNTKGRPPARLGKGRPQGPGSSPRHGPSESLNVSDTSSALAEVVIYGVVTLYQRYPAQKGGR